MGKKSGRPTIRWKLSKLKEHPRQAEIFGDIPDEELQPLAADMKQHGQRQPVEILPDGTIVAGHQRVRAAKLLGWTEIEVVIRDDLAEKGEAATEGAFIRDNLIRRHLSPLARARCIQRLMEIESHRAHRGNLEQIKAEIGKQLRMSMRNVNRYRLVLGAPVVIQQAFDRGEINLITAGKVSLLDEYAQRSIVRRIEAGERAKAVVAEFLSIAKAGSDNVDAAFQHLLRALKRDVPRLQGKVDEIPVKRIVRNRDVLQEALSLLNEILE